MDEAVVDEEMITILENESNAVNNKDKNLTLPGPDPPCVEQDAMSCDLRVWRHRLVLGEYEAFLSEEIARINCDEASGELSDQLVTDSTSDAEAKAEAKAEAFGDVVDPVGKL